MPFIIIGVSTGAGAVGFTIFLFGIKTLKVRAALTSLVKGGFFWDIFFLDGASVNSVM